MLFLLLLLHSSFDTNFVIINLFFSLGFTFTFWNLDISPCCILWHLLKLFFCYLVDPLNLRSCSFIWGKSTEVLRHHHLCLFLFCISLCFALLFLVLLFGELDISVSAFSLEMLKCFIILFFTFNVFKWIAISSYLWGYFLLFLCHYLFPCWLVLLVFNTPFHIWQ